MSENKFDKKVVYINKGKESLYLAAYNFLGYFLYSSKKGNAKTEFVLKRDKSIKGYQTYLKREKEFKKITKNCPTFAIIFLLVGLISILVALLTDQGLVTMICFILGMIISISGLFAILSFIVIRINRDKLIIYFIRNKSNTPPTIIDFNTMSKTELGGQILKK